MLSREWGYSFSHFDVDCSAGSEQVAALSVAADANITRLTGSYGGHEHRRKHDAEHHGDADHRRHHAEPGRGGQAHKGSISWTNGARLEWRSAKGKRCSGTKVGERHHCRRRIEHAS